MSASPAGGRKLTALVVVHNEETQLEACLSALSFADELVVVLDRCTDGSKSIAERAGVSLLEGAWELEGARRNEGIDACTVGATAGGVVGCRRDGATIRQGRQALGW